MGDGMEEVQTAVSSGCSRKYYRLKYRLAISHSADNNIDHEHSHVLEIEAYTFPMMENFQEFNDIEKHVDTCLSRFQNQYLNDLPEFHGDASLENTGEVLFPLLRQTLMQNSWDLRRFEISETPLRVYIITQDSFRRRCL